MIDFGAASRSILAHLSRATGRAVHLNDGSTDAGASEDGARRGLRPAVVAREGAAPRLPVGGSSGRSAAALGPSTPTGATVSVRSPGTVPGASPVGGATLEALPVPADSGGPPAPRSSSSAVASVSTVGSDSVPRPVQSPSATLLGGPLSLDTAAPTALAKPPSSHGGWQRFVALMVRVVGGSSVPVSTLTSPSEVSGAVARALVPELSVPNIEAAELGTRTFKPAVRPAIATVALAVRARMAWQKASRASTPAAQAHFVAEGMAWTERARRAARALQRALPPATEHDRTLRALLRTGLGALQDFDDTPQVAVDALRQTESSVRALASHFGIAMSDPLGPSGRSDVPGFWAHFKDLNATKTRLAVLAFALPGIVLGLVYLALSD